MIGFTFQCVKRVSIRSYSGPYSPAFELNTAQHNFDYEQCSYSVSVRPIWSLKRVFLTTVLVKRETRVPCTDYLKKILFYSTMSSVSSLCPDWRLKNFTRNPLFQLFKVYIYIYVHIRICIYIYIYIYIYILYIYVCMYMYICTCHLII